MTTIEKQIKDAMQKAFFDLIDEKTSPGNVDCEWLVVLYEEIKVRLLSLLVKDSKIYYELESNFDILLFKQMIENDVFDSDSMFKLVNTTFSWIKRLQAPIRDIETEDAKNRVFNSESSKIISTYLKEVHTCINKINDDLLNYYKSKN